MTAGNPHTAARTVRGAAELVTVTPANRLVADPYPRRAAIETATVTNRRDGAATGIVVGRLADGHRLIARTEDGDSDTVAMLTAGEPAGTFILVPCDTAGNHIAGPA